VDFPSVDNAMILFPSEETTKLSRPTGKSEHILEEETGVKAALNPEGM